MNALSKVGTGLRSSVTPGKRASDLDNDIEIDGKKTENAGFDLFLRLFLSRCLRGETQSRFELLQKEIEKLHAECPESATLRQTPTGEGDQHVPEDPPPTSRELELVKQRDELLNEVLDQCLHDVLGVADNPDIRALLATFADLIQEASGRRVRNKPYTDMYNAALRELAQLDPSSIRQPNFPLRLSHADPRPTASSFSDSKGATERKPDLVHTSVNAACATHRENDEERDGSNNEVDEDRFGMEPTTGFTWPQVLSAIEMRTFNNRLSGRAQDIIHKQFTSPGTEPRIRYAFTTAEALETSQGQSGPRTKRRRVQTDEDQPSQKRLRTSTTSTGASTPGETNSEKNVDARIQLAAYATEMLSYGPGVAYVINTLIIDEFLFLWYYDPQGSIRPEGISIVADFPRFLVLLLAFQRFTLKDWGIVPCLNPQALRGLGINEQTELDVVRLSMDDKNFSKIAHMSPKLRWPLDIALNDRLSRQPHRLSGRMTAVLKASALLDDSGERIRLAVKISRPEVQRIPEGDVLGTARAIALDRAPEMCDHLPELYFSGDIGAGDTLRIRSVLNLNGKGHRTFRVLVVNELKPLTTVAGESFVNAWLDVVTCHAFLWKHGVEHGDPSLSNTMYDPNRKCGVLTDFDLSTLAWLKNASGDDPTGTIPFMALDLLSDAYWKGCWQRRYHHELEAFIWILTVAFLAYKNGEHSPQDIFTKDWFTSDYMACYLKKLPFLSRDICLAFPSNNFRQYRWLMFDTCRLVSSQNFMRSTDRSSAGKEQDNSFVEQEDIADTNENKMEDLAFTPDDTEVSRIHYSESMWDGFISVLTTSASAPTGNAGSHLFNVDRLRKHKPNFDKSQCQSLFAEMRVIYRDVIENRQIGAFVACLSSAHPPSI